VSEIFFSIQGESSRVGLPTVFVRCAGCNLACIYCDTPYAREGGREEPIEHVLEKVACYDVPRLTVTGGEPLLQEDAVRLCRLCRERGYDVQVETNGSRDISVLPPGVRAVMDVKTPGSGMEGWNDYGNLERLREGDEVKFVLTSREDFEWALDLVDRSGLAHRHGVEILLSPARGYLHARTLAEWILEERCGHVRLQNPLHAELWPGERGK